MDTDPQLRILTMDKRATCPRCKTNKEARFFAKNSVTPNGLQSWCRKCTAIRDKERYNKNPKEANRKVALWKRNQTAELRAYREAAKLT